MAAADSNQNQRVERQTSGTVVDPSGEANYTILIIEDDVYVRDLLLLSLEKFGYKLLWAENGESGLTLFHQHPIDLMLLDLILPDMSGTTLCQQIRQISDIPIIILTAMNTTEALERNLEVGADDYIVKPFNLKMLNAQVEAILRRVSWNVQPPTFSIIQVGDVALNRETSEVIIGERQIRLGPTECNLLYYFMENAGKPISLEQLQRDVWGVNSIGSDSMDMETTIRPTIHRLRLKIEPNPDQPRYIVRSTGEYGYRFQSISQGTDRVVVSEPQGSPSISSFPFPTDVSPEIHFDQNSPTIVIRNQSIRLSKREHQLLGVLLSHSGQVVTKSMILEAVWHDRPKTSPNQVNSAVQRLRTKIELDPRQPRHIITVHGQGYRFVS